jgi:hypothetical protein
MSINRESKFCVVCGNTDIKFLTKYRATHPTFSDIKIVECNTCGMVFANPMPSENDLEVYNTEFFMNAYGGLSNTKVANAYFYAIARLRYGYIQQFLKKNNIQVNNVLEIGPGHGYFAENWILHHPDNKYFAIESDDSCYSSLNKAGVKLIDNTDFKIDGGIDLVVISHVLEHVAKPNDFLLNATKSLKRGGALFIEVPCQDWKHKPFDDPHLLFFDKKAMKHLLHRLDFENVETGYYGQHIETLQKRSSIDLLLKKIQDKLIYYGLIWPFSGKKVGMEELEDPFERAAVAQYEAHRESNEPAWWLRSISQKSF